MKLDGEDMKARADAAAWMVRLYGEDRAPDLDGALKEWLQAHPRNVQHFEEMNQVWELGGQVRARGIPRMRFWRDTRPTWRWAWVASALVLAILAGWVGSHLWGESRYVTERGEQRLVQLADGSRVTLNSSTRLQVDLTQTMRHVRLLQGEALFEVAQDAVRSFIVTAGPREIRALGTAFLVRYEGDRTAVTLVEGKVQVTEEGDSNPSSRSTLTPGQRVIFASHDAPRKDTPRIDRLMAWRRGEVFLDNTPLSEAVTEMNRYDQRQVVIDDPELGKLLVSGVYRSGDSVGFARGVARLHGLSVRDERQRIHLTH